MPLLPIVSAERIVLSSRKKTNICNQYLFKCQFFILKSVKSAPNKDTAVTIFRNCRFINLVILHLGTEHKELENSPIKAERRFKCLNKTSMALSSIFYLLLPK